jgi:hypothetical protein
VRKKGKKNYAYKETNHLDCSGVLLDGVRPATPIPGAQRKAFHGGGANRAPSDLLPAVPHYRRDSSGLQPEVRHFAWRTGQQPR